VVVIGVPRRHGNLAPGAIRPRSAARGLSPVIRWWEPAPRAAWREIADADPLALAFHTPAWMAALEASGLRDTSRLYEIGGRPVVVPLAVGTGVGRATAASLPYGWGFGGVLSGETLAPADVEAVLRHLGTDRREPRITIRPDPEAASAWPPEPPPGWLAIERRAHVLELDADFETVTRSRFRTRARRATRKAEAAGLDVEHGRSPRLQEEYQELHRRSVDRWARTGVVPAPVARWRGRRAEPPSKLRAVVEHLGDACEIWVARHDGRPAAAIVVLTHGGTASYWRGAIDEEIAGRTQASHLLHVLAIEGACAAGLRRYHLGETGTSASLAQFKEGFGAVARPYAELRRERLPITAATRAVQGALERRARPHHAPGASTNRASEDDDDHRP
jgi:Acetyltransferase (GNAT) domain